MIWQKKFYKISICLLSLVMIFSIMYGNLNFINAQEQRQTIANWNIDSNPETVPEKSVIPATFGEGFNLTTNATGTWGNSASYFLAASGFDGEAGSKYWQIEIPDSSYEDLQISFSMRRSKTMNQEWHVLYSQDGLEYKKVSESNFEITATSGALNAISWNDNTYLSIPSEARYIRIVPSDDVNSSGATCYLNNITLTALLGNKVSNVIIVPNGGQVALKTKLSMSCATPLATIYYQIGNDEARVYDPNNPPVLNELPCTIKVWATLDGKEDSDVKVYQFTEKYSTINEARNGENNEFTVKGIATSKYDNASLGQYIQDSTGGIMLYGDAVLKDKKIQIGDEVIAKGVTKYYSGKCELEVTDVQIISNKNEVLATTVTLDKIGDMCGGKYVALDEVIVNSMSKDNYNNTNLTLFKDGYTLNAKLDSRRGDDYEILAKKITQNNVINIKGILEGYNGSYILQLLNADDVTKVADKPSEEIASVVASQGSGELELNSKITLSCATSDAKIMYKLNDGEYLEYKEPITITVLPATLKTYAILNGESSKEITYTYHEVFTGTYNTYFGQLHAHTNLSDGAGSVESAFEYASKVKNLDFLAVTDHSNSFEGSNYEASINDSANNEKWATGKATAQNITDQKIANNDITSAGSTFLGVYGYEMTWSDGSGHINTFNTAGFENRNNAIFQNKKQSASNPSGLAQYCDRLVSAETSISQFNHPGTTFGDFYDFTNYSVENDARINLIEVGNGEGAVRSGGYFPSYEYYTRALDKGWHVAPTNNQDNHKGAWGDANTTRSVILAQTLDENSLYDALNKRRVYATEDNDLNIYYTLNDQIMGSEVYDAGETVHLSAKISDPTDKAIGTVEVIVNGGIVAASKTISENEGTVTFDLPNNYSYYYLRVTQPDQDIAVTAPVWTGEVEKAGIASVACDTELPVKNENVGITTTLYNNENVDMIIKSIEYFVNGNVIRSIDGSELTNGATLESLKTTTDEFTYIPSVNGETTINVVLKAMINGVDKTYNGLVKLDVADPSTVTKVVIDGTHFNDYVNGYYSGNMDNFIKLCANQGVQARIETNKIDAKLLKDTDLLVVTAPMKKVTSTSGDGMQPSVFEESFMKDVAEYVNNGGTVITCALADYQDANEDPYTSSTQINTLLKTIGSSMSINSDEVIDQEVNDGQSYRLKLKGTYNRDSKWLAGVVDQQEYSVYSGCSVNPGKGEALVKGFDTTYSINSRKSNSKYESDKPVLSATAPYDENTAVVKKGDVTMLAAEQVGQGQVFTAGTVFLSNFEVKADMDNIYDLQYINYNIVTNILDSVKVSVPTTSIAEVRQNGQLGDIYAVEGIVTAGSEAPNAFFDTIYIQDETGGIDIFPIANGSGIKVGNKVRVVGYVDEYQGDKELKIGNSGVYGYEIIDDAVDPLDPTELSLIQANDYENYGGLLAKVKGRVTEVSIVDGILDNCWIQDDQGTRFRIFVDGYINPEVDTSDVIQVGNEVSAIGVIYNNPDGVCLRVRDRNEIRLETVSKIDKSELQKLINEMLAGDGYSDSSYANYLKVINEGKIILADLNVTQSEVDHAVEAIKQAIEKLEKISKNEITKPGDDQIAKPTVTETTNKNKAVETGDNSNQELLLIMAIISIFGYSLIRKKEI
ncbi:CehA/McbA family metallohydrolase [Thomasclavelia saccharogumia]|uniref:CehA/McbA family metallohydrolase n=1 Tax=Thomasclavelia saccharogumia TaxID=341225 RepID=UPI00047C7152|nr:CehA/McbA family metallohydrolase [Thomasclavelia saccharogumia]